MNTEYYSHNHHCYFASASTTCSQRERETRQRRRRVGDASIGIMDDGGDWITARYLLSSILGRNPLVVDYVDEESFPVEDPPGPSSPSSSSSAGGGKDRRAEAPPPVRAPAGVAGTVCAVCTEEIAAADAVARLPCAHWYHHGCIAPWLGIRATCPMCRAELPPTEPDDEAGEETGAGRAKPAPARGVAAAGTSAGASVAAAAAARVRREVSYEYLAVAGGVVLSG